MRHARVLRHAACGCSAILLVVAIFSLGGWHETLSGEQYVWLLAALGVVCAAIASTTLDVSASAPRRGDASQKSSIFVASSWSILREIAHSSTGSSPSLRCERGVCGATRIADGAVTFVHLVAGAERQRPARDDVELLDLVVEVAGALLEVRVRRDADQRRRELLGLQRVGQAPELARDVGVRVDVVGVVGGDDPVVGH